MDVSENEVHPQIMIFQGSFKGKTMSNGLEFSRKGLAKPISYQVDQIHIPFYKTTSVTNFISSFTLLDHIISYHILQDNVASYLFISSCISHAMQHTRSYLHPLGSPGHHTPVLLPKKDWIHRDSQSIDVYSQWINYFFDDELMRLMNSRSNNRKIH